MPGTVIGKTMNYGYPGQISRHGDEVSRTRAIKKGTAQIPFGYAVKTNQDGTVQLMGTGDTADSFAGVAMRRVKTALEYPNQNIGYYLDTDPCDILERGTVTVECVNGDPKVGAAVHVYIKDNAGKKAGQFAAMADGDNTVELKNAKWGTPGKDARNVAEIVLMYRQGV